MSKNSTRKNLEQVIAWMESRKIIKKSAKGRIETPYVSSRFNKKRK